MIKAHFANCYNHHRYTGGTCEELPERCMCQLGITSRGGEGSQDEGERVIKAISHMKNNLEDVLS